MTRACRMPTCAALRRALATTARTAAFTAAVLGVVSCYPGHSVTGGDQLASTTTVYDNSIDFSSFQTYALADSVVHMVLGGGPDTIPRAYDAIVLERTQTNMTAAGFARVDDVENADLVVVAAITGTDNIVWTQWQWCDYWAWYYCPAGWGPPYPDWATTYSYKVGTVLLTILDRRDQASRTFPPVWVAAVNGVAGSASANTDLINSGIDQAFEQSPYLHR